MFYELSLINCFSSNFGSYRKCLKSRSRELHDFGDIDKRVKEETLTKHWEKRPTFARENSLEKTLRNGPSTTTYDNILASFLVIPSSLVWKYLSVLCKSNAVDLKLINLVVWRTEHWWMRWESSGSSSDIHCYKQLENYSKNRSKNCCRLKTLFVKSFFFSFLEYHCIFLSNAWSLANEQLKRFLLNCFQGFTFGEDAKKMPE